MPSQTIKDFAASPGKKGKGPFNVGHHNYVNTAKRWFRNLVTIGSAFLSAATAPPDTEDSVEAVPVLPTPPGALDPPDQVTNMLALPVLGNVIPRQSATGSGPTVLGAQATIGVDDVVRAVGLGHAPPWGGRGRNGDGSGGGQGGGGRGSLSGQVVPEKVAVAHGLSVAPSLGPVEPAPPLQLIDQKEEDASSGRKGAEVRVRNEEVGVVASASPAPCTPTLLYDPAIART